MKSFRVCDICGVTSNTKIIRWVESAHCYLCSKHKAQFYRTGQITDASKTTTHDKNEYIIKDSYAEIIIKNKKQEIKAIALIDIDDIERCKKVKWTTNGNGYVEGNSKKYKLHRFIMDYDGPLQIDHINRNKLDNRKENLRIVNQFENAQNVGAHGVSFDKKANKWKAETQRYGKYFFIGLYQTKENAIIARNKFNKELEKEKDILLAERRMKDPNHIIGVTPSSHGRWVAKFCADNKVYHVGTYDTKEEAVAARAAAILEHKNKTPA